MLCLHAKEGIKAMYKIACLSQQMGVVRPTLQNYHSERSRFNQMSSDVLMDMAQYHILAGSSGYKV